MKESIETAKKAFFEEFGKKLGMALALAMLAAAYSLLPLAIHLIELAKHWQQTRSSVDFHSTAVTFLSVGGTLVSTLIVISRVLKLRERVIDLELATALPRTQPLILVGPRFTNGGVDWTPVLAFWGDQRDTIRVGDPLCPPCNSPLQFFGDWKGHCPNDKCKKVYALPRPVEVSRETARLDAIGRAARGELTFPGKPRRVFN